MRRISLAIAIWSVALALPVAAHAFRFETVVNQAKALASKPWQPPREIPQFLKEISYEQYQEIHFKPDHNLWHASGSRFQVGLVSPGFFYNHPVRIHVVDREGVHDVHYQKDRFTFPSPQIASRVPPNLGYAGFRLMYPLHSPGAPKTFLEFAGASYFRGAGRDNRLGLSSRGIAIDTGLPSGEQFPSFVEYWLEHPAPNAHAMTVYALLDGKSITGAYQFAIYPGSKTRIQVHAVLFPRKPIALAGIAPLTSMFYYGDATPRPTGQWRRQVHDSDGLLIHNGDSGEWLWRPLRNPRTLQTDYFNTNNVRGFGLLQRHTDFTDYQDLGNRYDRRPSLWVSPNGDWGPGNVVLLQLPTSSEFNDNIVAFWTPQQPVTPGQPLTLSYNLAFGGPDVAAEPTGHATNTFIGDGVKIGGEHVAGAYRVIVDFSGGPLEKLSRNASVVSNVTALQGGDVLEHFVEYIAPLHCWRLSILVRPAAGKPLELRAYLRQDNQALSETWTYLLPADNQILPGN